MTNKSIGRNGVQGKGCKKSRKKGEMTEKTREEEN